MNLLQSALARTRLQHPVIFWGTGAMTVFTVIRIVAGGGEEAVALSASVATGPGTYVSPYEVVTPAVAAVPIKKALPKLSPVARPELDGVIVGPQKLGPKPRPELQGLIVDPTQAPGVLRPVERPELRLLHDGTQ